jgi:DNA (cytosine-5)-methyltransferase 1
MVKESDRERPIAVDLFAGAGGMSLGFEQAGFDVLAAVEIDPIHCATHEYNFPFWTVLCRDITQITGAEIRNQSAIGDRDIDVVFGGPPCQGFSLIGKRVVDDPRNSLVFHFLRVVLELKPKFFVMENVRGLAVGKQQKILETLIEEFRLKGYQVEENYQVLNAVCYGVPQARERLFLLGAREDFELPKYPQPITQPARLNSFKYKNLSNLPTAPTVWDAIGDLPEVEHYPELLRKDWVIAECRESSHYALVLRAIEQLQDDYSYEREYNLQILSSSMRTRHTVETIRRFKETRHGETEKISRFHKLHPDGICNTLRAGTNQHNGAFTSARPIHPFTPRCITVREAARLHSYPDWFRFHATKWHGFRQVGNSVPPLLAKAVAAEIIRTLNMLPFQPTLRQKLGYEKLLQLKLSQAARLY